MNFWDQVFLDNTIRQYTAVVAVILVAYIFKRFFGRYVSSFFFFLMRRMGRVIERQAFLALIVEPVENFLFVFITYFSLRSLTFPKFLSVSFLSSDTPTIIEGIGELLIIGLFFAMVLRLVDYIAMVMEKKADLTPEQDDNQLVVFFKDFLKVIIVIIGVITIIKIVFHQDISNILAGLSIVGAAMALAARESLENLIASFIIFFDKPFTAGDLLKVNNITGTVERIGLRSTRIRTVDKTYVTMPNKQMVDSMVDNLSLRTHRRTEMKLLLDRKTGSSQLNSVIDGIKSVLQDRRISDYNVLLNDITNEGYLITLDYLSIELEFKGFNTMKEEINLRIVKLLEELNVEMAGTEKTIRLIRDQLSSPEGNV
jgi:MscS family membrane protein